MIDVVWHSTDSMEQAIVERLRSQIDYVEQESIRQMIDARTAINLDQLHPPALVVEYEGESTEDQHVMGRWLGITTMEFSVYCVAASFTNAGNRVDTVETLQSPGAYTLVDDVFRALAGWPVLGDTVGGQMVPVSVEPVGVLETHVIYRSRWRFPVTRIGYGPGA